MSRDRRDDRRGRDRDYDRGRDRDRGRERRSNSRERRDDRQETSSLLVRNLSYAITSDEIRRLFDKYGDIRDVYIPMDFYTKKPKGFAFVEFYDHRDARSALYALDRYSYDGRELGIVFAKDKRKTSDEMRRISSTRERSRDRSRDRRDDRRRDDGSRERDRRGSKDFDKRSPSPDADRSRDTRGKEDDYRPRDNSESVDRSDRRGSEHDE